MCIDCYKTIHVNLIIWIQINEKHITYMYSFKLSNTFSFQIFLNTLINMYTLYSLNFNSHIQNLLQQDTHNQHFHQNKLYITFNNDSDIVGINLFTTTTGTT